MSVTPDFIGQIYKDTNTGNLWRANSLTPGDWTLELQNSQVKWVPTNVKFGQLSGYYTYDDCPGITSITMEQATLRNSLIISSTTTLLSVSAPNLTAVTNGIIDIDTTSNITSISFPQLASATGIAIYSNTSLVSINLISLASVTLSNLSINSNPLLTSLNLPALVSQSGSLFLLNNTVLTTLNVPLFVPNNGEDIDVSGCALNQSSVDMILARCVANAAYVSGNVKLTGGTNSPPTNPLGDKATLIARGCNVTTN